MSARATAMSAEFYQVIGSQIAAIAPDGWVQVELHYAQVAHVGQPSATVVLSNGDRVALETVPSEVVLALHRLRTASYQLGAGTWFDADVLVHADGRITADFNYDNPPRATFDPELYAADFERFPRDLAATPAWLTAYLSTPSGWHGARWQLQLTAPDSNRTPSTVLDATTTEAGHALATQIVDRLGQAGQRVRAQTDRGEDGRGNPTTYDELLVDVGKGYMAIAFFRDLILWTADVAAEDADRDSFSVTARTVLATLTEVSGFTLDPTSASRDERELLDIA